MLIFSWPCAWQQIWVGVRGWWEQSCTRRGPVHAQATGARTHACKDDCRTSSSPGIMWWLRMTGLRRLGLQSSQYSRASMFTLRWSMPSWQMSAWGARGAAASERSGVAQRGRTLPANPRAQHSTTSATKTQALTPTHLEEEDVGGLHAGVEDLGGRELVRLGAPHDLGAAQDALEVVLARNVHHQRPVLVGALVDLLCGTHATCARSRAARSARGARAGAERNVQPLSRSTLATARAHPPVHPPPHAPTHPPTTPPTHPPEA